MIVKLSQLNRLRKSLKNKRVVFVGGSFDMFHRGHLEYLKKCRNFGDVLVVAIATDRRIKQRKGEQRPIISQKDRLKIIDSVSCIDYCLIAPEKKKDNSVPAIVIMNYLKPDIFVTTDKRWKLFRDEVEGIGVEMRVIERNRRDSTTRIISRILKQI